ncbi:MAG TPA: hypothetical protein VFQ45_21615 [Longimicrobium sp.]|nr:hypothetical protein [Longimicrobium sp.]
MTGPTIDQLVANAWAERLAADDEEVLAYWRRAIESFRDAGVPRLSHTGQFKQLYDSARQGVVAFNAAHGYRARGASAHHQHTFACGVALAPPELKGTIAAMQAARSIRHDLEYGGTRTVSAEEIAKLRASISNLLEGLAAEIERIRPKLAGRVESTRRLR